MLSPFYKENCMHIIIHILPHTLIHLWVAYGAWYNSNNINNCCSILVKRVIHICWLDLAQGGISQIPEVTISLHEFSIDDNNTHNTILLIMLLVTLSEFQRMYFDCIHPPQLIPDPPTPLFSSTHPTSSSFSFLNPYSPIYSSALGGKQGPHP